MVLLETKHFLHKLTHWEYWPQWLVYAPISPVYIYYSIRCGTPFFHMSCNPTMENGGFAMESKYLIHLQLPEGLKPATIVVEPEATDEEIKIKIDLEGIQFPVFAKPDIGGKGRGVEKIQTIEELLGYHHKTPARYLIQNEIPFHKETGIFYCRFPGTGTGVITGIVQKTNMQIIGNGKFTIKQWIEKKSRLYYQRHYLYEKYKAELNVIIPDGQLKELASIGNHARGSEFADITALKTKELSALFDRLSDEYNTLYFGRYDIKYNSWEELCKGKNFMIIELNGCGAEPTHIYDPKKPIWKAWKILLLHWRWMYKIAREQNKKGVPFTGIREGIQVWKKEKQLEKLYRKTIL